MVNLRRRVQRRGLVLEPVLAIGRGGARGEGTCALEDVVRYNRPIVGLNVDEDTGEICLVREQRRRDGGVIVHLEPETVTHQNGFKVETVARAQVVAPFEGRAFDTSVPVTFTEQAQVLGGGPV